MKKRFFLYGIVVVGLAVVLIVRTYGYDYKSYYKSSKDYYNNAVVWVKSIWDLQTIQTTSYDNLKIQYDYGFLNNKKILHLLSNMKNSNPAQIQKYKLDLKQAVLQITKQLKIDGVDFIESKKITNVVIRHKQIDKLHMALQQIREYGIVIKSIRIFKPNDKYNMDIKISL